MTPVPSSSRLWLPDLLPPSQWEPSAACRTVDPQVFFPSTDGQGPEQTTEAAKRVCNRCPVRRACLAHAMQNQEPVGIWGGLTTRERGRLLADLIRDPRGF
ncbi:WhiB family transcriptional regulator [Kitasatospora indigofera]